MAVKVSVIVPVYNPGGHMDDLIASMLRQTMPADEFEVIFADDASTDGTAEALDALAQAHDNFSVVHNAPNSGWPGRPRNLGIDAARGEFVFFVDNDDWIGARALERMYAYALENGSDVVVGREVGHGRGIPAELFRINRPRATLADDPLVTMLTPHKMFRKAFLDEHALRFPEGRRRLEDHVFVLKAYFLADVVSVLSDYGCYHWVRRPGDGNASARLIDPAMYYGNVREVLDIVEAHTEPGEFQDRLLSRWYGAKAMQWIDAKRMVEYPEAYRVELLESLRELVHDRFPSRLDRYLTARHRVRAELLRARRDDELVALSAAETGYRADTTIETIVWESDVIVLTARTRLVYGDGAPVQVERRGDMLLWVVPGGIDPGTVSDAARDLTEMFELRRAEVLLRNRATQVDHVAPGEFAADEPADGVSEVTFTLTARIDPRSAAGGRVLSKTTDLYVRIAADGWIKETRAPDALGLAATLPARVLGGRTITAYATETVGNLSLKSVAVPKPVEELTPADAPAVSVGAAAESTAPSPAAAGADGPPAQRRRGLLLGRRRAKS